MQYRKLYILQFICALLAWTGLYGQEGKVYVANNPLGPGIAVRWAGPEIFYQEGIRIYRRQGRKDWELLTAQAILPPATVSNAPKLTTNDKEIVQAMLDSDHREFVDGFGGILTLIESLKRYPLALALKIAYNDETAEKGKKYSYKVEAIVNGQPVILGETEEIKCSDYAPLAAPANLQVLRKKQRSFVWWDVDEAHHYAYNVYLKKGDQDEFLLMTREIGSQDLAKKKDKFIDVRTHKDTTYTVRVEALDYFGGKTEMSEPIELKIIDFDPPAAPELLVKSDSKAAKMTITWKTPAAKDLAGYELYRKLEEVDTVYTKINRRTLSKEDTLYVDQLARPGAYTYRLDALDETGNVGASFPITGEIVDIIPPPVPQYFEVKADTGRFILRWQPVNAPDLRGYIVLRSVADENNEDNIFMPASAIIDTNYFAEPMAENVRAPFVYVVRSVDSLLNYSLNSKSIVAQLPDVTPPVSPMIKTIQEEGEALRIVWTENVEKDLKGYNIYKRKLGDTLDFEKLNGLMVPKDIAAYTDKEAERGASYEYFVVAIDYAELASPNSNVAKGRLGNLPLEGTVDISRQKFNPTKSEFSLFWTGNQLINEPIVGYAVFRSLDGNKELQRGQVSSKTEFKEKLSKPGRYTYHIRVYGERGHILHSEPIEIEVEEK